MPTDPVQQPPPGLPLVDFPAEADAWHAVRSPGGFEWWHFEATDSAHALRVVARLYQGYILDRDYLRRYRAYRRRPISNAPPLPAEYPAADVAIYRNTKLLARSLEKFQPQQFSAAASRVEVHLGPNTLARDDDGAYRLHLAVRSYRSKPSAEGCEKFHIDLAFSPRSSRLPTRLALAGPRAAGTAHWWIIAAPVCDVRGTIHAVDGDALGLGAFSGRGYHDHHIGTRPPAAAFRRWLWDPCGWLTGH